MDKDLAILACAGSSICGSSAVMATQKCFKNEGL